MLKNLVITLVIILTYSVLWSQDPLHILDRELPCVEKKFYAYIHVALDSLGKTNISEEEIRKLLDNANIAFAPICISFDYCKMDTITDYSFDNIEDEVEVGLLKTRFHKKRRLNIYLVQSAFDEKINSYSSFNGIRKSDDCIMVVPKSGRGFIHELGQTFGLYHTFERKFGVELVNRSNCKTTGDKVCDTPADAGIKIGTSCLFANETPDANGDYYRTEIGNYMTHAFCAHCFFTTEQYEIMAANYLTSSFKMW